ncbi:unnamed protein product [Cylicocyclus nassatus]|uniref:Uncharacterized protein n=1 Tax=Cylicocyclus nassatus TaxID=53992 RepID=A0AA36H8I0_CYLNA|nr:unnamed protein product [Cylicocyclus nassatus]
MSASSALTLGHAFSASYNERFIHTLHLWIPSVNTASRAHTAKKTAEINRPRPVAINPAGISLGGGVVDNWIKEEKPIDIKEHELEDTSSSDSEVRQGGRPPKRYHQEHVSTHSTEDYSFDKSPPQGLDPNLLLCICRTTYNPRRYGNSLRARARSEDLEQAIPQVGPEDVVQHVTQAEQLVVEVTEVFNEVNEIRDYTTRTKNVLWRLWTKKRRSKVNEIKPKTKNRASRCGGEAMQMWLY